MSLCFAYKTYSVKNTTNKIIHTCIGLLSPFPEIFSLHTRGNLKWWDEIRYPLHFMEEERGVGELKESPKNMTNKWRSETLTWKAALLTTIPPTQTFSLESLARNSLPFP